MDQQHVLHRFLLLRLGRPIRRTATVGSTPQRRRSDATIDPEEGYGGRVTRWREPSARPNPRGTHLFRLREPDDRDPEEDESDYPDDRQRQGARKPPAIPGHPPVQSGRDL